MIINVITAPNNKKTPLKSIPPFSLMPSIEVNRVTGNKNKEIAKLLVLKLLYIYFSSIKTP